MNSALAFQKEFLIRLSQRRDLLGFLSSNLPLEGLFELPTDLAPTRVEVFKKLYKGIGHTCTYHIPLENDNQLKVKLEYSNPMGNSHYSRYWLIYLFIGEMLGMLAAGRDHILETTSGSSGIALAMAANALHYDLTLIVPRELPDNRIEPMRVGRTRIELVKGYLEKCVERLSCLLENEQYVAPNHSRERGNIILKVFRRIAFEQFQVHGAPDIAILALGNGSTVRAIGGSFKELNPKSKVVTFEPDFRSDSQTYVFGLIPPCVRMPHAEEASKSVVDDHRVVSPEMLQTVLRMYKHDSMVQEWGDTSLYALYFAMEIAKRVEGKKLFSIAYDLRDRY
jgi:cysteine synthase A